jgi:TP901 family phage tail tape measure protein
MSELAKAGLSVNNVMAASKGVLQLSAAGQLSNAQAAEVIAGALNMFALTGEDAVKVADPLAADPNRSSAGVTDMADALKMSGNVAASADLGLDQLVTSISLMANAGIKGSDAGTEYGTAATIPLAA